VQDEIEGGSMRVLFYAAYLLLVMAFELKAENSMDQLKMVLQSCSVSFKMGEGMQNNISYPILVMRFNHQKDLDLFFKQTEKNLEISKASSEQNNLFEITIKDKVQHKYLLSYFQLDQSILLMATTAESAVSLTHSVVDEKLNIEGIQTLLQSGFKFESIQVSSFIGMIERSMIEAEKIIHTKMERDGFKKISSPSVRQEQLQSNLLQSYWIQKSKIANVAIEKTSRGTKVAIHETFDANIQ